MFDALADRHAENTRNPKYEYARRQLTRGALAPSKIFDDTAAWTGRGGSSRALEVFGSLDGTRYHMVARPNVPMPMHPAEGKHLTTLTRVADGEYRWDTDVDYAIGNVRPADVSAVITRLISAAEGRSEREVRADLQAAAPRSSAALGTLFSLDTLRPVQLGDGTTAVTLGISVHAETLRRRLPALAQFVSKYVEPARYRLVITDRAGTPYLDASQHDRFLTIRLRTQDGHLVALSGAPRALPETLLVQADFNAKMKIFRVGFHNLVMDFVRSSRAGESDWTFTARREPQWDLPFITARLLRSPLRRPFAGEGSQFRIGIRGGGCCGQTVIARESRLYVQESAILNFLNSLSSSAAEEFGGQVENEENVWLRELFSALRDDAGGVLAGS